MDSSMSQLTEWKPKALLLLGFSNIEGHVLMLIVCNGVYFILVIYSETTRTVGLIGPVGWVAGFLTQRINVKMSAGFLSCCRDADLY